MVREKLVSLEIPFVQHTCNRGSSKRQLLVDKYGKFAVPYLEVSFLRLSCMVKLVLYGEAKYGTFCGMHVRAAVKLPLYP